MMSNLKVCFATFFTHAFSHPLKNEIYAVIWHSDAHILRYAKTKDITTLEKIIRLIDKHYSILNKGVIKIMEKNLIKDWRVAKNKEEAQAIYLNIHQTGNLKHFESALPSIRLKMHYLKHHTHNRHALMYEAREYFKMKNEYDHLMHFRDMIKSVCDERKEAVAHLRHKIRRG